MPREKSRYRDRRSSSRSSEDSYDRKKVKSKYKRRSRSRDKSEYSESSSNRRKRSTSRSKQSLSYSRSLSRERHEKSRRRSSSRTLSRRDRSVSRSSSRSRRHKVSKKSRRRCRSSSSRSSSNEIEHPQTSKVNLDDTETKVEKAIKAAEAAGLTMTKIPSYEYKEVEIKEDMPTIYDRNLLAELNSDSFVQKSFVSSRKKESKNIVIDLNAQTVKLSETDMKQKEESILDFSEIPNEEELKEMWIKKLYQFRKRMLKGEI